MREKKHSNFNVEFCLFCRLNLAHVEPFVIFNLWFSINNIFLAKRKRKLEEEKIKPFVICGTTPTNF